MQHSKAEFPKLWVATEKIGCCTQSKSDVSTSGLPRIAESFPGHKSLGTSSLVIMPY